MDSVDREKRFLIVGIAKDIAKTFGTDYKRINSAIGSFGKTEWFIVESDSNDESSSFLENFKSKNTNFNFVSLGKLNTKIPLRTERLAEARNTYLQYFSKMKELIDYVVICDFNNLNNELNVESINSCWTNLEWDVCTANQSGRYYDIWALRHPLWSPNDCWEAHAFNRKYLKIPELALYVSLHARMIKIPKGSEWIEVESAFGGLAIYKAKTLAGMTYSGLDKEGNQVCEHVALHQQIRENGYKIYINPDLINARITDHSRNSRLLFKLWRITLYPSKKLFKNHN